MGTPDRVKFDGSRFDKIFSGETTRLYCKNSYDDYICWRYNHGKVVEITDIQVSSERRKGVGRALVEQMLRLIPDDIQTVYAITRADNLISQQFYEKLGFEVTGVLRRFYQRGCHAVDGIMYGRSPRGPI